MSKLLKEKEALNYIIKLLLSYLEELSFADNEFIYGEKSFVMQFFG